MLQQLQYNDFQYFNDCVHLSKSQSFWSRTSSCVSHQPERTRRGLHTDVEVIILTRTEPPRDHPVATFKSSHEHFTGGEARCLPGLREAEGEVAQRVKSKLRERRNFSFSVLKLLLCKKCLQVILHNLTLNKWVKHAERVKTSWRFWSLIHTIRNKQRARR